MFDGSSVAGWKGINESDMILMPEAASAKLDPFFDDTTMILRCDIIEPSDMQGYNRDPRSIAKRAEAYMASTGIADTAYFGPENEFFVFDDVKWADSMGDTFFKVDSEEAAYNSGKDFEDGNTGHRPAVKGGYFPVPPVDSLQDIRSAMCLTLEAMGQTTEVHHHEVGTAGQCEIGSLFNTMVNKADEVLELKYVVQNIAHAYGKTATFMPKPLVGDNGNGMHVHQSLSKDGENIFAGDLYGGLSETALFYIGGIIKHAKAINAFANASTNSYKRLIPGFEAPVLLAYSARNRSASCRIPFASSPKGKRVEVRFPDSTANPYLAFTAMLMAGLDGIKNKIEPVSPVDKDLYELPPDEAADIKEVPSSLEGVLNALEDDHEFLGEGNVFTPDLIETWIDYKRTNEIDPMRLRPHPHEFEMYYDI